MDYLTQTYIKYSSSKLFWILYALLYFILFGVSLIGYYTFFDIPSPIIDNKVTLKQLYGDEVIELRYKREYTVKSDFVGTVQQEVVCSKSHYHAINSQNISFVAGEDDRSGSILISRIHAAGDYSLITKLIWKPKFSLADHIVELSEVKFKICKNETECV